MKVQQIKPKCSNCTHYTASMYEGKNGWCGHVDIPGGVRRFPPSTAEAGIQPDCPLIEGDFWRPQIKLTPPQTIN